MTSSGPGRWAASDPPPANRPTLGLGDEVSPLVRPSALALGRVGLCLISTCMLLALGAALLNELLRTGTPVPTMTLNTLLALLLLTQLGLVVTWVWMFGAIAHERARGYTTTTQRHLELPEVDPGSGRVIRQAGADALTRAERRDRLTAVRDAGLSRGGRLGR